MGDIQSEVEKETSAVRPSILEQYAGTIHAGSTVQVTIWPNVAVTSPWVREAKRE